MKIYDLGNKMGGEELKISFEDLTEEYLDRGKHLLIADISEFEKIASIIKFPEETIKEALNVKQYPNAEFYDDLLFLTLNNLSWNQGGDKILAKEINIYLGRNNLLIVHHGINDKLDRIYSKIDHSDIYRALYSFIDQLLDSDRKMIGEVEDKALKLEDKILKQFTVDDKVNKKKGKQELSLDQFMDQIVKLRKQMQTLKKYIEPSADIVEILEADESDLIPEEYDKYFMKLSLKADRLAQQILSLRDYIAQVRETWQTNVDLNFNKIMKYFTVATAIFLPLTLVTGWYGMNFQHMPELSYKYSYPIVFIVCLFIGVGGIWWFKKNKYI